MSRNHPLQHLLHWNHLAQEWLQANPRDVAYSLLLHSFGLARLGERTESRSLLREAQQRMRPGEPAEKLLLRAFTYRIEEAREGRPHRGPLPVSLREQIQSAPSTARYVVDRLRMQLRTLEPNEKINPYAQYFSANDNRKDDLSQELEELSALYDPEQLHAQVRQIQQSLSPGRAGRTARIRVLIQALAHGHRLSSEHLQDLVHQSMDCLMALPRPKTPRGFLLFGELLRYVWSSTLVVGSPSRLADLQGCFQRWIRSTQAELHPETTAFGLAVAFHSAQHLGRPLLLESLVEEAAEILGHLTDHPTEINEHQIPVALAEGWLRLQRSQEAWPYLDAAREGVLYRFSPQSALESRALNGLVLRYAQAVGCERVATANEHFEELLSQLPVPEEMLSTREHYSTAALQLLEVMILSVVPVAPPYFYCVAEAS